MTTCDLRAHLCILTLATLATLASGCVAESLSLGEAETSDGGPTTGTSTEGSTAAGTGTEGTSGATTADPTGGATTDTGVGETDEPMLDLPGGGEAGACCTLPGEIQGPGEPPPGCNDPEIEACVCAVFPSCCDESWDDGCVFYAADSCGAGCTAQTCNCDPLDVDSCDGGVCITVELEVEVLLMCAYPPETPDADGEPCDSNFSCEYGSLCGPPSAVPTCEGQDGLGCCTPTCDLDAPSCLEGQSCVPMYPGGSGCAQNLGICTAGDQQWWMQ